MGLFDRHVHRFIDQYGGLYADEVGGPKTYHENWGECACGALAGPHSAASKARAEWTERSGVEVIIPRTVIFKKAA